MELAGSLIVRRAAERLRPTRAGGAAAARPASTPPQACPSLDREMLRWSAGETVAVPQDATLASLVAAQAQRTPQATALVVGEERLDYATLHRRAAELAPRLAAAGVRRGSVVGLALPRTAALLQAVLAVHLAGGAYLPLDPALPAERLDFMCADAGVQLLLTTAATIATLAPALARLPCRIARLDVAADLPPAAAGTACDAPAPDDLAYVLYTSGSTGRPKGVGVAHRSVVNFLHWARSVVEPDDLAGVLFSTPLGFDIAVLETFLPLAFGGRIVLVDTILALPAAPARATVRLINSVPSLLEALLRVEGLPGGLRTLLLGGEALPRGLADRLLAARPELRLLNLYGPTEATVYAELGAAAPRRERAAADRPADLEQPALRARRGRRAAAPGAAGELWIAGAPVARGYLGRPELTEERFRPDPFGPDPSQQARMYRTGDRARWRPDRQLEFLGRLDDQIKINGVRIELGEIEAALRRLPGVAAAAAALRGDDGGPRGLVGWLVAEPGGGPRDAASLRAALREHLPEIMIPASFVWAAALPLTANGKLDRRALSRPPAAPAAPRAPAVAVPTPTQNWRWRSSGSRCCRTRELNADDDFFELGGDSLAAVNLLSQVDMRFGVRLATDVLAEGLTVARLARLIEAEDSAAQPGLALALQPLGDGTPFYCLPGIGDDPAQLTRWRAGWAPGGRSSRCAVACRRSPTGRTGSRTSPPAMWKRCWRGIRAARSCSAAIRWAPASPTRWRSCRPPRRACRTAGLDRRPPTGLAAHRRQRASNVVAVAAQPAALRARRSAARRVQRRGALPAPPPARATRRIVEARSDIGHHPLHRRALAVMGRYHGALVAYRPEQCAVPLALLRARAQPLLWLFDDPTLGSAALARRRGCIGCPAITPR